LPWVRSSSRIIFFAQDLVRCSTTLFRTTSLELLHEPIPATRIFKALQHGILGDLRSVLPCRQANAVAIRSIDVPCVARDCALLGTRRLLTNRACCIYYRFFVPPSPQLRVYNPEALGPGHLHFIFADAVRENARHLFFSKKPHKPPPKNSPQQTRNKKKTNNPKSPQSANPPYPTPPTPSPQTN